MISRKKSGSGNMINYKEVFARHGYSLFEPESIELAIIEAIKEHRLRYLYGIPIILERSEIDLKLLIGLSKKEGVWSELIEMLYISSRIIKDKKKARELKALSKGIKRTRLKIEEFKKTYNDQALIGKHEGFSSAVHYQLSFIFAKRQIQILYNLKRGAKLSKTEKEYFSRVIKKKLLAIREVYPLAKELLVKG
jgi:hypothetical protein